MNIFTITGEIVLKGRDIAEKQLVNLQGTASNVSSRMENSFKRLGSVILTAFSTKALINFSKKLAETSATVHEEVAQFKAVLGDLEDEMTKRIANVSKQTGILETRLRKTSTAVYAMMHSSGMETETALDNTERFLKFASDASAFYDKSMEEVQSDLQSFMRGVTRAGYSIGLYTSELQRNEKAMEKFGVKYEKLNQEQRYSVMLDIIEQTYELAGVTGQATRESEQWLNVTSNLKEAWKQFSAVLGQPIMTALLKPMKDITNTLLNWKTRLEGLYKWWEEHSDVAEEIRDKFIMIATAVGIAATAFGAFTLAKTVLQNLFSILTGSAFTAFLVGLGLIAVVLIRLWNTNDEFRAKMTDIWNKIKTEVEPLITSFGNLFDSIGNLIKTAWDELLKPVLVGLWNFLNRNGDNIITLLTKAVDTATELVNMVTNLIKGDWTGASNALLTALTNIKDFIEGAFKLALDTLGFDFDKVKEKADWLINKSFFSPVIKPIVDWTSKSWETFKNACLTGDWSAILGEGMKWATIGITFVEMGVGLKTLLTSIITAITGLSTLGIPSGVLAFACLSIGVQFVEAWKQSDYDAFISNILVALSAGLGTLALTGNGKLSMLVMTIAINFKVGEFLENFDEKIREKVIEWSTPDEDDNAFVKQAKKQGMFLSILSYIFSPNKKFTIPAYAEGGIVDKPTLALIGEAGAEMVIPMKNLPKLANADAEKYGIGSNISIGTTDSKSIASEVVSELKSILDFSVLGFSIKDFVSNLVSEFTNSEFGKTIMKALGYTVPESGGGKDDGSGGGGTGTNTTNPSFWEKLKSTAKKFYDYIFDSNSLWDGKVSEIAAKIHDSLENIVNYVQSYVTPLFDAITELQNQQAEKEIENLEKELETIKATHEEAQEADNEYYAGRLQELFHMLDIGAMSYEDYADAVQKLDDDVQANKNERDKEEEEKQNELLTKKDELAKKQFEAEKRTSIAMVWVNSALAVMKAFSELGPIGGAVASALILATAGVQTATIAQQEYTPMLAEGGVVDKATHAIIGEDGAEAVVPLERNLGWVNGLANALEPTISAPRIDYTPQIQTISEQIDEMKQILANFLPMLANQNIVLDGATVARKMTPYLDGTLGQRQRYANRGL